jgi:general secretion pathway protein G
MATQRRTRGFTLVEMLIVLSIISILVAIALPQARTNIVLARESVLKEDLFRFRELIDQYYADKGRYPASLATLTEEGYLRRIPADPMTGAADWQEVPAEPDPDNPSDPGGVYDVHSSSTNPSLAGEPYSEW